MAKPLLRVSDLRTYFISFRGQRVVKAVDGVSFTLEKGETLGLVGESGCGKTTTCHSIFRLLPPAGRIVSGVIEFAGTDLMQKSPGEMQRIRGRDMAMILQDPMASLNPLFTIFDQVAEPAYFHRGLRRRSLRERIKRLLEMVRIPSPATRMHEYPHQMSGGMRQRIVGATALAGEPKLIVADEPTTNLDVTIQLQYLDLLKDLQRETGVALIFVTHDLGIVAKMCDKVAVMYAGKIVEQGSVREIYYRPRHPYTEGLLKSVPRIGSKDALYLIPGQPPDLAKLPLGCPFSPRCPQAMERCRTEEPEEYAIADGHTSRCWLPVQEGQHSQRFPGNP
jgi:oligopeptide transport system ATP-binding protein